MGKQVYSCALLIFSIISIMALIAKRYTRLSNDVHPAVAYIVGIVAILWLTMVEGGQASLVGMAPVNPELYKDSHPIAYKCAKLGHKGDNLDRYLLGRQFMVVLVVFSVNMSFGPTADAELWGYPQWVIDTFFEYGLAMILFTCMVGQLNTQVNASHHMLDYIDNYFGLFTLWVAMFIEFTGLLHSSYVVQLTVAALAGQKIESNEEPRDGAQNAFFWARCIFSLAILVFFLLMSVVGMLEGMQIAFFAVAKIEAKDRGDNVWAKKTCDLLYSGDGRNLPGFMVGRQLCVVSCMLFIARVTSVGIDEGESNIFNVRQGTADLFATGLLGAFITTIVASISWQLVASAFPIAFLSSPITYILLRWCLFLESTGICAGAWTIAAVHKKIAGFQRDEVYIGTAEERANMVMSDHTQNLAIGPGKIPKLPNFAENAPNSLKKLMKKDPSIAKYINSELDKMDNA